MTDHLAPDPLIAFPTDDQPEWNEPAVAIHVNFGLIAARQATAAEIGRLAETLLDRVERVTIVAEARYEVDRHSEAAVQQIRVEAHPAGGSRQELERWLVDEAERWARACVRERN